MTTPEEMEATACRHWRVYVAKLTRPELAAISGYSMASIATFEQGHSPSRQPLSAAARRRYRLICAAINAGLHEAMAMRCNRCHRPMAGTTSADGACACGGLIEAAP